MIHGAYEMFTNMPPWRRGIADHPSASEVTLKDMDKISFY